MRLAMRDLRHDAVELVDPRVWARAHPLATVAAAFAAGFAVTRVAAKEIEPAEPPKTEPTKTEPTKAQKADAANHAPGRMSRLFSVVRKIWSAAEPFVRAAIIARMSENQPQDQHQRAA
jgi:hypothetical protein